MVMPRVEKLPGRSRRRVVLVQRSTRSLLCPLHCSKGTARWSGLLGTSGVRWLSSQLQRVQRQSWIRPFW